MYNRLWKIFVCVLGICALLYLMKLRGSAEFPSNINAYIQPKEQNCFDRIRKMNFTVRVVVIDNDCLLNRMDDPLRLIRVAVEMRDVNDSCLSHPLLRVVPFIDSPSKDYWEFRDDDVVRIVPRFRLNVLGNAFYPANIPRFTRFWMWSRKMECKNATVTRNADDTKRHIPLTAVNGVAKAVDSLYDFGMHPLMWGGTLLGWYRECSLIPHTLDIDFVVAASEYTESFINFLKYSEGGLRWSRILGMPTEGFEITLKVDNTNMDVFYLYTEGNTSFVGGLDPGLTKYRYTYPRVESRCSVDLLNHHFFAPCDVLGVLTAEYGVDFMKDHPTRKYAWNGSAKNVKNAGKWPESMRKKVYQTKNGK